MTRANQGITSKEDSGRVMKPSAELRLPASGRTLLYTPVAQWSDGIHFVRGASVKDRHPMRFVIVAHKDTRSKFSRHVPTLEEGIARAREATKRWLKDNPADARHWTEAPLPEASGEVESTGENSATQKPILQPFALTHFNCIYANPVAQVWQRVTHDGERRTPGRRTASGRQAEGKQVDHIVGQCAVFIHDTPVRDHRGCVIVYPTWSLAAEAAQELYDNADEDDRLTWKEGHKRVYATRSVDVIFDPEINGLAKPFSLYLPEYRRPVYEDRTRVIPSAQLPPSKINAQVNPQAKLDEKERRAKHRAFHREPSFEERPLKFRTIYGAIAEAERREKMLKGEIVV